MFYIVKSKIYCAEHDGKVYPEVKLRVDSEGKFYFTKTGTGLATKPANRQLLTTEEVFAKFGASATVEESAPKGKKTST